jgi:2-polyprenyl-3-methyl-5-hydroxy-6-metoxy-1,4-benzoquinol methylase
VGEKGQEVSVRTVAWYDQFYKKARRDAGHEYGKNPSQCVYSTAWGLALDWIGADEKILDIGCGPGQFAQLAIRQGRNYVRGIDFSREAVVWARERNAGDSAAFDACAFATLRQMPEPYDVAVLLEVVEHVDDDLGLLAKIRPGAHVVFSVPNYGFTSHVRHFPKPSDAVARYGDLLTLRGRHAIDTRAGKCIWLFNATRKAA